MVESLSGSSEIRSWTVMRHWHPSMVALDMGRGMELAPWGGGIAVLAVGWPWAVRRRTGPSCCTVAAGCLQLRVGHLAAVCQRLAQVGQAGDLQCCAAVQAGVAQKRCLFAVQAPADQA